ncbi:toll-like receptor 12 isoform X1 [Astyanax mexicanus]|uniref:toll-like receptor 12 isoform X1 n=1 Tax=Astyanax mexicanus TaxID=7994 RepID=UPI0020CAC309|nr:toll-like receptor 12 isoform X1 [Astyanax mexicanus]
MFQSLKLLLCFSLCDVSFAVIAQHCFTFKEQILKDIGSTLSCDHRPGHGDYAECNISDFRSDLTELTPEVRSLCIFHKAKMIPEKAFSQWPSLEILRIFGEQLNGIMSKAFIGLSNLKFLKITFDSSSKCRNVSLEDQAFAGLENLQELELTGFQFKNISSSTFNPLRELVSLRLAGVCVKELSEVFCSLSDNMALLQHLSLEDSGVSTIDKQDCMAESAVLAGVKDLNLDGNPIQVIEEDSLKVFQNLSSLSLKLLEQFESRNSIWKSGIGQVDKIRFSGPKSKGLINDLCSMTAHLSVRTLELSQIAVDMLSEKSLQNCSRHLKTLSICSSKIQQIDFRFWKVAANIESLTMSDMGLKEASFCKGANGTIWNITSLNLENNLLKEVHANQFGCMPLLERLVLSRNSIETLFQDALSGLPRLRTLKLNSNKIKQLSYTDFESLSALEILLIDNNTIQKIEEGAFRKQKQLQEMTLGTLLFPELYLTMIFYGFPPKMQNLSIETGHHTALLHLGVNPTPERLSALNLNIFGIYIDDCNNTLLKRVRELKLMAYYIACDFHSFWTFFPNLESFEYKGDSEGHSETYGDINTLRNLRRLKLTSLNFANNSETDMMFWNLKKLQVLTLVNCHLNFLTKSMFKDLLSLQLLRIDLNNPLTLLDGMFDPLPSLRAIVLDELDFRCDCENNWFLDWAESSKQVQVIHLQRQQCVWHYQKRDYLSTMEKLCQTDVQYLCYLGSSIAIALLLSASIGYRFAYWPCMVLFFRLRGYVERKLGGKWRIKRRRRERQGDEEVEVQVEEEEEEEMKFDAFVSFSRHDEAWVLEELAPRLEEEGQQRLRLCLHSRDFEVGKGIVNNISESIYRSRRTVCVLSRQYLRSDWCSLEMRVATYRLLEEQEHSLILIFLQHISPFQLTAFHRLVTLVKSRTYLEWPEDLAKREHFWECLRRNIVKGDMSAHDGKLKEYTE